jgi:plasmid stabilization system protein ParE
MAYRISARAKRQLAEISSYLIRRGTPPEVADRLIDDLTDTFWQLTLNPRMGRPRDYDLDQGLRSLPVRDYIVLYRIHKSEIVIHHVLRGARDLPNIV